MTLNDYMADFYFDLDEDSLKHAGGTIKRLASNAVIDFFETNVPECILPTFRCGFRKISTDVSKDLKVINLLLNLVAVASCNSVEEVKNRPNILWHTPDQYLGIDYFARINNPSPDKILSAKSYCWHRQEI